MTTENNSIVSANATGTELVPAESANIQNMIYTIRGQQVMLNLDLAKIHECKVKAVNYFDFNPK